MITFKHLLRIFLAYVTACLVTAVAAYGGLLLSGSGAGDDARANGPIFIVFLVISIAWFSSGPAALMMAYAEFKAFRLRWLHMLTGAVTGLVLGVVLQPPTFFPYFGLLFGGVAGWIYWRVAGRHAGLANEVARRLLFLALLLVSGFGFLTTWSALIGIAPF